MAVGAPTSRDIHQYHLALKARFGVRNNFAVQSGETESKWFGWIFDRSMMIGIGGRRQTFRARDVGPRGGELALAMQIGHFNGPRPIGGGSQDHQRRTAAREVAKHELSVFIATSQRAGVAIDAQN